MIKKGDNHVFETIELLQSYVDRLEIEGKDQFMIMVGENHIFVNELISYRIAKVLIFEEFSSLLLKQKYKTRIYCK